MIRERQITLEDVIAGLDDECAGQQEDGLPKNRISQEPVFSRRYVDIKYMASYLGCAEPTLRDWVRFRKIPFFKAGKLVRFDLQRIDQWAKEKAVDN